MKDLAHLPENLATVPAQGYPCELHTDHAPEPLFNHRHHIWPLGLGGPDESTNVVFVCPVGHDRVHALLRLMYTHDGSVPWTLACHFGSKERALAKMGYERAKGTLI